jgi:hypothetical protein
MSRGQHERASRFQLDIERDVRIAAAAFRDNDVETSITSMVRLWWTSRLRGRRFAELVRQAHDVTQARLSLGAPTARVELAMLLRPPDVRQPGRRPNPRAWRG